MEISSAIRRVGGEHVAPPVRLASAGATHPHPHTIQNGRSARFRRLIGSRTNARRKASIDDVDSRSSYSPTAVRRGKVSALFAVSGGSFAVRVPYLLGNERWLAGSWSCFAVRTCAPSPQGCSVTRETASWRRNRFSALLASVPSIAGGRVRHASRKRASRHFFPLREKAFRGILGGCEAYQHLAVH